MFWHTLWKLKKDIYSKIKISQIQTPTIIFELKLTKGDYKCDLRYQIQNLLLDSCHQANSIRLLRRQIRNTPFSARAVTLSVHFDSDRTCFNLSFHFIGLFDFSEPEFVGKEIVKCINMAKDGIHVVLVVLSVRTHFSREEQAAVQSLREFFGSKISDYMILVFTGGNDLEDNNETLDDYLGRDCSEFLKNTLTMCGNRKVLFDNKTGDPLKKADQLTQLLFLVNVVVEINGGKPYTNDLCKELNKGATKLHNQANEVNSLEGYSNQEQLELMEQMQKSYEEQLKQITAVVESKLRRVENQLAKEQAAWLKTELSANKAQKKSDEEIRKWMIYSVIQLLYYSFHRRE